MPENDIQIGISYKTDSSSLLSQVQRDVSKIPPINLKLGGGNALGQMSRDAADFTKSMTAAQSRTLSFALAVSQLYLVQKIFSDIVRSTVEVEKALTSLNSVFNLSSSELSKFGSSLFRVANETGASFKDVATAATEFSRAGLDANETLKRTRDALTLTRLSGLELGESVKAITAALSTFNDITLDSTVLLNKLASVDVNFAVTAGDLAQAIFRTGSTAKDTGVEFDNLIGIITSLQQTTQRGGAIIGNALKSIFTKVTSTSVLESLKELGVSVEDLQGNTKSAEQILISLAKSYETSSEATQNFIVNLSAGLFQANQFRAILSDLAKENSIYSRAVQVSSTATDQATQRQIELNKSLSAQINETKNNLIEAASRIGSLTVEPFIKEILKITNSFAKAASAGNSSEDLGTNIAVGIVRGIGNYLSGPGIALGAGLFAKLFLSFANYAKNSFASVLETLSGQAKVQGAINDLLARQPAIQDQINKGSLTQLEIQQKIAQAINQQTVQAVRLSEILSAGRNLIRTPGLPGLLELGTNKPYKLSSQGGIVNRAMGHIPEKAELTEKLGAYAGGYTPGAVKQINIPKLGNVIYNTAETIKTFPGLSQPAILPPVQSKAGIAYTKDFQNIHGFNPYVNQGYIPNYVNLSDIYSQLLGFTSQNKIPINFKAEKSAYFPLVGSIDIAKEDINRPEILFHEVGHAIGGRPKEINKILKEIGLDDFTRRKKAKIPFGILRNFPSINTLDASLLQFIEERRANTNALGLISKFAPKDQKIITEYLDAVTPNFETYRESIKNNYKLKNNPYLQSQTLNSPIHFNKGLIPNFAGSTIRYAINSLPPNILEQLSKLDGKQITIGKLSGHGFDELKQEITKYPQLASKLSRSVKFDKSNIQYVEVNPQTQKVAGVRLVIPRGKHELSDRELNLALFWDDINNARLATAFSTAAQSRNVGNIGKNANNGLIPEIPNYASFNPQLLTELLKQNKIYNISLPLAQRNAAQIKIANQLGSKIGEKPEILLQNTDFQDSFRRYVGTANKGLIPNYNKRNINILDEKTTVSDVVNEIQINKTNKGLVPNYNLNKNYIPNYAPEILGEGGFGIFESLGKKLGGLPVGRKRFKSDVSPLDITKEYEMTKLASSYDLPSFVQIPKMFGNLDRTLKRGSLGKEVVQGQTYFDFILNAASEQGKGNISEKQFNSIRDLRQLVGDAAYKPFIEKGMEIGDFGGNNLILNDTLTSNLFKIGKNSPDLVQKLKFEPKRLNQVLESIGKKGGRLYPVDLGVATLQESDGLIPNYNLNDNLIPNYAKSDEMVRNPARNKVYIPNYNFKPGGILKHLGGLEGSYSINNRTFKITGIPKDNTFFITGLSSSGSGGNLKDILPQVKKSISNLGYSKIEYRPDNQDNKGAARERLFESLSKQFNRGYIPKEYVPNYNNPLSQAIEREKKAGIPENLIRISQSPNLKSSLNPLGLGVYNTKDEPAGLNQGINRYANMGLDPKMAGIYNKGFFPEKGIVPNYAPQLISEGPQKLISTYESLAKTEFTKLAEALKAGTIGFNEAAKSAQNIQKSYILTDESLKSMNRSLNAINSNKFLGGNQNLFTNQNQALTTIQKPGGFAGVNILPSSGKTFALPENLPPTFDLRKNLAQDIRRLGGVTSLGTITSPILPPVIGNIDPSQPINIKENQPKQTLQSTIFSGGQLGFDFSRIDTQVSVLEQAIKRINQKYKKLYQVATFEERELVKEAKESEILEATKKFGGKTIGTGRQGEFLNITRESDVRDYQKNILPLNRFGDAERQFDEYQKSLSVDETTRAGRLRLAALRISEEKKAEFIQQQADKASGFFSPFTRSGREARESLKTTPGGLIPLQNANNELSNKQFLASFLVPVVLGAIQQSQLLGKGESTISRGAIQSAGSLGNVASFGLTALAFTKSNPIAGGIGAGLGLLFELPKLIEAFTSEIPDLDRQIDKLKKNFHDTSEALNGYVASSEKLADIYSGKLQNITIGQINQLETQQAASLAAVPNPEDRNRIQSLILNSDFKGANELKGNIAQTQSQSISIGNLVKTIIDFQQKNIPREDPVRTLSSARLAFATPSQADERKLFRDAEAAERRKLFENITSQFTSQSFGLINKEGNSLFELISDPSNIGKVSESASKGIDSLSKTIRDLTLSAGFDIDTVANLVKSFDNLKNAGPEIIQVLINAFSRGAINRFKENGEIFEAQIQKTAKTLFTVRKNIIEFNESFDKLNQSFEVEGIKNIGKLTSNIRVNDIESETQQRIQLLQNNGPNLENLFNLNTTTRQNQNQFKIGQTTLNQKTKEDIREVLSQSRKAILEAYENTLKQKGVFTGGENKLAADKLKELQNQFNETELPILRELDQSNIDINAIDKIIEQNKNRLGILEKFTQLSDKFIEEFSNIKSTSLIPLNLSPFSKFSSFGPEKQLAELLEKSQINDKEVINTLLSSTPEAGKALITTAKNEYSSKEALNRSLFQIRGEFSKESERLNQALFGGNRDAAARFQGNREFLGEQFGISQLSLGRTGRLDIQSINRQGLNERDLSRIRFNQEFGNIGLNATERLQLESRTNLSSAQQTISDNRTREIDDLIKSLPVTLGIDNQNQIEPAIQINRDIAENLISKKSLSEEDVKQLSIAQDKIRQLEDSQLKIQNINEKTNTLRENSVKLNSQELLQKQELLKLQLAFNDAQSQNIRDKNTGLAAKGDFENIDLAGGFFSELSYNRETFFKDFANNVQDTGRDLKQQFKDAFVEAGTGAKTLGNAMRDAALQFGKNIAAKSIIQLSDVSFSLLGQGLQSLSPSLSRGAQTIFNNRYNGGYIKGYARGGLVKQGSGLRDDVPGLLEENQYVVRKQSVEKLGLHNLERLNRGIDIPPPLQKDSFSTEGNRFKNVFANEFYAFGSKTRPKTGQLNVSSNLSDLALTDTNNPQNNLRFARERYFFDKRQFDIARQKALDEWQEQRETQLYISIGSAALGSLGQYASKAYSTYQASQATQNVNLNTSAGTSNNPYGFSLYSGSTAARQNAFYLQGNAYGGNNGLNFNNFGGYIEKFFKGGRIKKYEMGGPVFGAETPRDTIPALLTGGEFVFSRDASEKLGPNFLNYLNKNGRIPGYANGGLVGNSYSPNKIYTETTNKMSDLLLQTVSLLQNISDNLGQNKTGTSAQNPVQSNGITNNVTINVTMNNNQNPVAEVTANTTNNGNIANDKGINQNTDSARRVSEMIKVEVIKVLNNESRNGGSLYNKFRSK